MRDHVTHDTENVVVNGVYTEFAGAVGVGR